MKKITHYPFYDVMSHKSHWDEHTAFIVQDRLVREHSYRFLTPVEAETLRVWCSLLVDDDRGDILQYVLCHIDQSLADRKGEGQRKAGVPTERVLIREGLKAIDEAAHRLQFTSFFHLEESAQRQLMQQISENSLPASEMWDGIPQKPLFQKILSLAVEAYYSHPTVWSEIGYGGPAYPRGYVRSQLGQLDPWEAVQKP